MSNVNNRAELPPPLSLTLEEAAKVAGGGNVPLAVVESWWWKGGPILQVLNPAVNVAPVAPLSVGPLAAG